MPENKKISLNFGRIKQRDITVMAHDTLGEVPVAVPPDHAASSPKPRGPVALTMIDDNTLEVTEPGLISTFNFATRKVTYVSQGAAVNCAVLDFADVKSPTAVADAFENLGRLGGKPRPYTP